MQRSIIKKSKCNENGATKEGAKAMLQKTLLKCCYKRHYPKRQPVHLWQVNVYQPFFFLCLFLSMSPCREDDYERCAWCHLLVFLPRQKTTTNATFVVVFWYSYEIKAKDKDKCTSSSSSTFFFCIAEYDDESKGLLSSFVGLFWVVKYDKEPHGLSSSLGFFPCCVIIVYLE